MPRLIACLLMVLTLTVAPARADGIETKARFDIFLLGAKVAEMHLSGSETGEGYVATARLRTTGLAGALARVRFNMKAKGVARQGLLSPLSYAEDIDTGRRSSKTLFTVKPGPVLVPAVADPGIVPQHFLDPMSALFAVLRDRPAAGLCALDSPVFDGERVSHVTLRAGQAQKAQSLCLGHYRRVRGYSEQDMAERSLFPFSVQYREDGGMMIAHRVRLRTLYGPVVLRRR